MELDGKQINHPICLKPYNICFRLKKYIYKKKDMSVLAISFDYFPTYFIIALRLIKGKNSLYMVKIILHFKRAFMKILCFVKRILIHVISLVKQFLHPFFSFLLF